MPCLVIVVNFKGTLHELQGTLYGLQGTSQRLLFALPKERDPKFGFSHVDKRRAGPLDYLTLG